jgi:hypothetical protein
MVYGCLLKYSDDDLKAGSDGWTSDRLRQVVNKVQNFRFENPKLRSLVLDQSTIVKYFLKKFSMLVWILFVCGFD